MPPYRFHRIHSSHARLYCNGIDSTDLITRRQYRIPHWWTNRWHVHCNIECNIWNMTLYNRYNVDIIFLCAHVLICTFKIVCFIIRLYESTMEQFCIFSENYAEYSHLNSDPFCCLTILRTEKKQLSYRPSAKAYVHLNKANNIHAAGWCDGWASISANLTTYRVRSTSHSVAAASERDE